MNDNLRYKSLQYIKGDNYDNITCFKFDEVDKIKYEDPLSSLIASLKGVKKNAPCNIGEKLIDDLINYYQFKNYKKKIEEHREKKETHIKELADFISSKKTDFKNKGLNKKMRGKTTKQIAEATIDCFNKLKVNKINLNDYITSIPDPANMDTKDLIDRFVKFYKILKEAINITSYEYDTDYDAKIRIMETCNTYLETLDDIAIETLIRNNLTDLKTEVDKLNGDNYNIKLKFKELEKLIKKDKEDKDKLEHIKKFIEYAKEELKFSISSYEVLLKLKETSLHIKLYESKPLDETLLNLTNTSKLTTSVKNTVLPPVDDAETKKSIIDFHTGLQNIKNDEDILKNLIESSNAINLLENAYSEEIKDKEKEKSDLINLVKLFNEHYKICEENIKKYDKLFKYNDISGIDDAFMIKSYSDFLKKLNKLKENLESKDEGKIKRSLLDSIKKLIHLYGLNINNKATLDGDNLTFLANRIVNYM